MRHLIHLIERRFTMTLEFSVAYFIAVFIFSITPGPGVFALIAKAIKEGAHSCIGLSLGMTLSDIAYLLLVVMGLAYIANEYALIFDLIRYFGSAYLFFLAIKIGFAKVEVRTDDLQKIEANVSSSKGFFIGFGEGLLISATNPKVMLFYLAFLPTFVDLTTLTSAGVALVIILNFSALMAGLLLVAYGAGKASQVFSQHNAVRRLNQLTAVLMAAAGFLVLTH